MSELKMIDRVLYELNNLLSSACDGGENSMVDFTSGEIIRDYLTALEAANRGFYQNEKTLKAENAVLLKAFSHDHRSSFTSGIGPCTKCGLRFDHPIHSTAPRQELPE